ncbi:MAG: hypothetical protein IJZ90_02910 [Clostridia bacterium]|nr:hypothetical protein [Clostridia bacterium]
MRDTYRYKIADLIVDVTHNSDTLRRNGSKYVYKSCEPADIKIDVPDENISYAMKCAPAFNEDYAEYFMSGTDFYRALINYNGFMIHSSCVAVDGKSYLFSADSGVGKSTHTSLWCEYLGKRAVVLNDDKPAVRFVDGAFYAYGTPWSGKNDLSCNERAIVSALVFIERDKNCSIEKVSSGEAVKRILPQMIRYIGYDQMDKQLSMLDCFLSVIPAYLLRCTPYIESAELAWETLKDKN